MKMIKLGIILFSLFTSYKIYAYGSGASSYPLPLGKKLLTAEFLGITSSGGGMGLQVRFAKKLRSNFLLEGGMGISGGNRSSRIFLGGDWEIYPDHGYQPRFSLRGRVSNAKEFGVRQNRISIAPSLGKAVVLKGRSFYPYLSFPCSISFAGDKTYNTTLGTNLGLVGNLPFRRYEHIVANIEASVGIRNSFAGFVAGLSWPME